MNLAQRLDAVIAEHDLLKHPFYQAWTAGKLDLNALRAYAAQYAAQVDAFPRYVSAVHSRCPDLSARKVLLQNLVDEELHGTDHPTLWRQFAEGLGVSAEALRDTVPLPETTTSVDRFHELTQGPWARGLCALYAYESQVPRVSQSKIEGLERHYGVKDARTLAFFKAHLAYDVEHSRAVAELIERHAAPEEACSAAGAAAEALWTFLDGVSRELNIAC